MPLNKSTLQYLCIRLGSDERTALGAVWAVVFHLHQNPDRPKPSRFTHGARRGDAGRRHGKQGVAVTEKGCRPGSCRAPGRCPGVGPDRRHASPLLIMKCSVSRPQGNLTPPGRICRGDHLNDHFRFDVCSTAAGMRSVRGLDNTVPGVPYRRHHHHHHRHHQ